MTYDIVSETDGKVAIEIVIDRGTSQVLFIEGLGSRFMCLARVRFLMAQIQRTSCSDQESIAEDMLQCAQIAPEHTPEDQRTDVQKTVIDLLKQ